MILTGHFKKGGTQLANYLANTERNERSVLLEIKGTFADDLRGALLEMSAAALGSQCQKPFYHLTMSPEPPFRMPASEREQALAILEERLGFEGHPRVVVLHEKENREHYHIVWTRLNMNEMNAPRLSFDKKIIYYTARELEERFNQQRHEHIGDDIFERNDGSPAIRERRELYLEGRAFAHQRDPTSNNGIKNHAYTFGFKNDEDQDEQKNRRMNSLLALAYSRGDDYVNQSEAAQEEHRLRQKTNEEAKSVSDGDICWRARQEAEIRGHSEHSKGSERLGRLLSEGYKETSIIDENSADHETVESSHFRGSGTP